MVKKVKYFYFCLLTTLLICLTIDVIAPSENISFLACAYFIIFIALAFFLILRGVYYKIDTNLYFGILLFISPAVQTLIYFDYAKYYHLFAVSCLFLTIASLIIWKYFKDKTHKFLFFVFLGEMLIFFIPFCLTNFKFWYLIILAIKWLLVALVYEFIKIKKR